MIRLLAFLGLIALTINQSAAQCARYPDGFEQYDIMLCPLDSSTIAPVTIERPNYWLPNQLDTGVSDVITFNFSVEIYGLPHNQLRMNTNGALYFGSLGSTLTYSALPLAITSADNLPIIGMLNNSNEQATIQPSISSNQINR